MRSIRLAFFFSLVAAVAAQGWALSSQGLWWILPGLGIGLIWILDFEVGKHRTGMFSFLVLMIMNLVGFGMSLSSALLLASAGLALAAWDLDGFAHKLRVYDPDQGFTPMVRTHLGRLLGIVGAGLLLAFLPLMVKTHLNLPAAVILGLIAVLCLAQSIHYLRDL